MEKVPAVANEVVTDAAPEEFSVCGVPICVVPLKKVMVPLGVPPGPVAVAVIVICDPMLTVVPEHPFAELTARLVFEATATGRKFPPRATEDVRPLLLATASVLVKAPGTDGVACMGTRQSIVLSLFAVQFCVPITKFVVPLVSV